MVDHEAATSNGDGTTALLVVDAQRDMLELDAPVPHAEAVRAALASLLQRARSAGTVVVHVQNDGAPGEPDEPGTPGWQLVFSPVDDEMVVRKDVSDAFAANPHLQSSLGTHGVRRIVVCGMQSNYCVAATSRGALSSGFEVVLASGAHATYDEEQPAAKIAAQVEEELRVEGVTVVAADDITFA